MTVENIREIIKRELPILVSEDEELRDLIRRLYRSEFTSRSETNDRFDQLMTELRKDREEQAYIYNGITPASAPAGSGAPFSSFCNSRVDRGNFPLSPSQNRT